MRVLIDADFLIALAKEDDTNHAKAIRIAEELRNSVFFITPFTVSEAVTVLSYKVSHAAAKEFLKSARGENFIELPIDAVIVREADGIFLSRNERGTSWIDCLNVAVVRICHLDGILSFDKFYAKIGISNFERPQR